MTDRFLYFAYGSNMWSRRLLERTPSAVAVGTGHIESYRLTFDKVSIDGSGKCNITSTTQPNRVYGVLFRINLTEAQALDRAEGLGKGYEKAEVRVVGPSGAVVAVAYIANRTDPLLRPYDWYKEFVIRGATEHELPEAYIDDIRSVASNPDPDPERSARNRSLSSQG